MICAEATRRSRNYAPNDQKDWHKAHRSAFCRQNHAKASGQACCCADFDHAADRRPADHRAADHTHRAVSRIADQDGLSSAQGVREAPGRHREETRRCGGTLRVRCCSSRTQTRPARHDAPSYCQAGNPGSGYRPSPHHPQAAGDRSSAHNPGSGNSKGSPSQHQAPRPGDSDRIRSRLRAAPRVSVVRSGSRGPLLSFFPAMRRTLGAVALPHPRQLPCSHRGG